MFPMAQSGLVTVTIFNFINIWNEYFLSLIFANNDALRPVAVGLYGMLQSMQYTGNWAGMFAAVIIVFDTDICPVSVPVREIDRRNYRRN